MKKIFTTKVILDIHPDGDIYIFDGKSFWYAGWLIDEESEEDYNNRLSKTQKRAMRLFKKFKIKSPLKD